MTHRLRVLIACEFSGVVRRAFTARGHDAWSCDLLPAEDDGPHIQGDAQEAAWRRRWDLMIAHPPCTFLTNAGAKHLYIGMKKENGRNPVRWADMERAADFFRMLLNAPIPHVAVENPIMLGAALEIVGQRPAQFIQPWQFGHPESKRTGFWLRNLPPLVPTTDLKTEMQALPKNRSHRVHYASPGPDRWKARSRTLPGIAEAMAGQWGFHCTGGGRSKEGPDEKPLP